MRGSDTNLSSHRSHLKPTIRHQQIPTAPLTCGYFCSDDSSGSAYIRQRSGIGDVALFDCRTRCVFLGYVDAEERNLDW